MQPHLNKPYHRRDILTTLSIAGELRLKTLVAGGSFSKKGAANQLASPHFRDI